MSSQINHTRSKSDCQTSFKKINIVKSNNASSKIQISKEVIGPSNILKKNINLSKGKVMSIKPSFVSKNNPFYGSQKSPSVKMINVKANIPKKPTTKDISLNISMNPNNLNNSNHDINSKLSNNHTKSMLAMATFGSKIPLSNCLNLLQPKTSSGQLRIRRNVKKIDISNQSMNADSFTTGITEKTTRFADKSINISSHRLNHYNISKDNKTNLTMTMSSERVNTTDKPGNSRIKSKSPIKLSTIKTKENQRNFSPCFFNGNNNKNIPTNREYSKNKLINNNSKLGTNINNLKKKDKGSSPFILIKNQPNQKINFREMNTSPFIRKPDITKISTTVNKTIIENAQLNSMIVEKVKKNIRKIQELSKVGFSGEGSPKKINQDNFFIYKNFSTNFLNNSTYFGVCDGHGALGHEVSLFLRENLPKTLDFEIKRRLKVSKMNKIIEEVFLSTNEKLVCDTPINTHFSGSTCVSVIYTPEKLICANVGDSRAVLGRYVNDVWKSHNLSRDHKPSDTDESTRIISRNGRIEAYRDEYDDFVGPARVWLIDDDIPGLAMSRSFGDQVAASVGVICEPGNFSLTKEIMEWEFTNEDKFMVIGSDGVFEFIDSSEIVEIVKDFYIKNDIQGCVETLVEESTKRWMKEEQVIDDITVIVVFFD